MAFQHLYSKYYDLIYADKNYQRESEYIFTLIKKYNDLEVTSVLDIACGTGVHAFNLAKMNLTVVASDISSDMISIAATKKVSPNNPRYLVKDMRSLEIAGKFQVAICMFSAFDYLTSFSDIESTLAGVSGNLDPGGLFIMDVWNGIAVLNQRPSTRIKHIDKAGTLLLRYSESEIDVLSQIIKVNFKLVAFEKGFDHPIVASETHILRYFFPEELRYIFERNGFDIIDMHPFLEPNRKLNEDDWNMTVVARKRKKRLF